MQDLRAALIVANALVDLKVAAGHDGDNRVSKDSNESAKGDKKRSSKPGTEKKRVFPRSSRTSPRKVMIGQETGVLSQWRSSPNQGASNQSEGEGECYNGSGRF